MPKLENISSVLVLGAGPIVIGQACEFDYSGTQACKALKEEGLRVILVNSNPATIMTDPEIADATYIEPITVSSVEKVIEKEAPDALLSTVGGQTALNCSLELWRQGILKKHKVSMMGATPEAIEKAESREKFNQAMKKIGLDVTSHATVSSLEEAMEVIKDIGLPAVIRPSFTLGGSGGGLAETMEEFKDIVSHGLDMSPANQVLIDESIVGWKEYEMEVIRDRNDNAIIICSIENIDPMGIHTGDSITVAPALTLTDKEYQVMRDASIRVLKEIGVETGGANVQFAVNPKTGQLVVIEMNPRVSRSSALASKATGFPIAKVAAKLAIGYTLDEISNDITKVTPASFEPTLDYIVTKIPRFNFEKFHDSTPTLSTAMRSVGEVMSLGRSFTESLMKGLCSLERGLTGLDTPKMEGYEDSLTLEEKQKILRKNLRQFVPDRLLVAAEALRQGLSMDEIHEISHIDVWFLEQLSRVIHAEKEVIDFGLPKERLALLQLKKLGLSDARLAKLSGVKESDVFHLRQKLGVRPVYKTVDTCAAEFSSSTSYLYSCYENSLYPTECELSPSEKNKVIILGSGPNRIGQGIEFDYACVHAAKALSQAGLETIMVNCNPETVSTDYDTSDKLLFEPLQNEHVLEIAQREQEKGKLVGVVVQFGGQTPLKLSHYLQEMNVPIIGTSPDSIDLAENRERFQKLLRELNLKQPRNSVCYKVEDMAETIQKTVGYPALVRPSHVLGGRAMANLTSKADLDEYLKIHKDVLMDGPILIDRFLENAVEVDVDAICDGDEIYIAGVMEHIERAGIHSGDSACVLPPRSISKKMLDEIKKNTTVLVKAVQAVGLANIQYAIKNETLYVIEVNPRASRTTPFVAKATGVAIAKIAALVMVGRKLSEFRLPKQPPSHHSIKEVVLPFVRFPHADTLLGPEMKSTGEVMGWDPNFHLAFRKAQISAMNDFSQKGMALVGSKDRKQGAQVSGRLKKLGYEVIAVGGMESDSENLNISKLSFLLKEKKMSLSDFMMSQKVQFVSCVDDSDSLRELRRALVVHRVPYFSTYEATCLALETLQNSHHVDFSVRPIQSITQDKALKWFEKSAPQKKAKLDGKAYVDSSNSC